MPDTPTILDEYFTRKQLAAELGVCWRTVLRWQHVGYGPPITKIGQRPLYRRSSVATWLAAREQGTAA